MNYTSSRARKAPILAQSNEELVHVPKRKQGGQRKPYKNPLERTAEAKRGNAVWDVTKMETALRQKSRTEAPRNLYGLIAVWFAERRPAPDSMRSMQVVARSFLSCTGVDQIDEWQRGHLLMWQTVILEKRKRSPSTWNSYLSHLKVLVRVAENWGIDSGNLLDGIKQVSIPKTRKRIIEDYDLHEVIRWLDDPQNFSVSPAWFWKTVIRCLYYTGIRRRQLVGLTWGDIDLGNRLIHLRAEHSKTKREWDIPLPGQILQPLAELQKEVERQLRRPVRLTDQLFNVALFTNRYRTKGQPAKQMTVDHVSSAMRRIKDATGVEISAHRFRHTFASKVANNGGNLKELQTILGHTNLSTTMGYVQPKMDKMREIMGGIGNGI